MSKNHYKTGEIFTKTYIVKWQRWYPDASVTHYSCDLSYSPQITIFCFWNLLNEVKLICPRPNLPMSCQNLASGIFLQFYCQNHQIWRPNIFKRSFHKGDTKSLNRHHLSIKSSQTKFQFYLLLTIGSKISTESQLVFQLSYKLKKQVIEKPQ